MHCEARADSAACRIERVTGRKPHPLLRRHVFYAHRDLADWLDCYEKGIPCYLYTGAPEGWS